MRHTNILRDLSLSFLVLFLYLSNLSCNEESDSFVLKQENLPIIMVHGALASGDTYSNFAKYFLANDYPKNLLFTFDWNSIGVGNNVNELDQFINKVLGNTGKQQVYLMGHSAGGGLCYSYCNDAVRASKIAKYVHLASNKQNNKAGNLSQIPTLNLFSKFDKIVAGTDIFNAINKSFDDLDHYEVATSLKSFKEVYKFLLNETPVVENFKKNENPTINGRVVTLGENQAKQNLTLKIHKLDENTAERLPNSTMIAPLDSLGYFKNVMLDKKNVYEFEVTSTDQNFRTVHYFKEKMEEDNPFVYIRIFPPSTSFAGLLLANLPNNDDQSVIAVFSASRAMISQRDELIIQNNNLCNDQLCKPENSTIALFLYDNANCKTEYIPHNAFNIVPFLKGADVYFPLTPPQPIILTLNSKKLVVKNFKSKSDGVTIAVFD
jgi:hypothetical protein